MTKLDLLDALEELDDDAVVMFTVDTKHFQDFASVDIWKGYGRPTFAVLVAAKKPRKHK